MVYGDFKDLPKRTASDKVLRDKTFNIAKYSKYDGCQRGPSSMFTNILIKSPFTSLADKPTFGGAVKNEITSNERLPKELYKPINRKF